MSGELSLSAVVPATNEPPTLSRCLEAIRGGARAPDELLAVTDPPGAGPAAARNQGAGRASGEVVVFVDADVAVHRDALARIESAFAADPELTALFGSYDDAPEAPGAVSGFRNLLHHHVHQSAAGPALTFWAGLGAVRREAFLAAGGFDASRYPLPSIEDIELGARLSADGARIMLDPELRGTHLKRWTVSEVVRTDFSRRGVPWAELVVRSEASPSVLNLGWSHRASAALSLFGAVAIVRRRPSRLAAALIGLVLLNRRFYALLVRRRGVREAAAGVGLHALHHLTSTAALIAGAIRAGAARGPDQKSHQRS